MIRLIAGWLWVAIALAGCAAEPDARANAARIAEAAGLRRMVIPAGTFDLVAYTRFAPAAVLRIYIEGDGHAWRRGDTPSEDPTPWSPVALELASVDPAPSLVYLARPCQYIAPGSGSGCRVYYWTAGRYAEPVIASTNTAIDRLMTISGAKAVELIGFSGGGAVAALVSARRRDVANLRTVAANLDTETWIARQRLSPLTGSLNPADFAARLTDLPQRHFGGGEDTLVGTAVLHAYLARFGRRDCVDFEVVPGTGHRDGWKQLWPSLLRQPVRCTVR